MVQLNHDGTTRKDWSVLREAKVPTFYFHQSVDSTFHQILAQVPGSQQVENIWKAMLLYVDFA